MDESSSIESFFRDGSMRCTDQRTTRAILIYCPVSVPYLRGRTHSVRVYVCITFAFGGEDFTLSRGWKRPRGRMSRLSELLWLPNGHNMCVTYVTLNASSTPPLSLNLKRQLRGPRNKNAHDLLRYPPSPLYRAQTLAAFRRTVE